MGLACDIDPNLRRAEPDRGWSLAWRVGHWRGVLRDHLQGSGRRLSAGCRSEEAFAWCEARWRGRCPTRVQGRRRAKGPPGGGRLTVMRSAACVRGWHGPSAACSRGGHERSRRRHPSSAAVASVGTSASAVPRTSPAQASFEVRGFASATRPTAGSGAIADFIAGYNAALGTETLPTCSLDCLVPDNCALCREGAAMATAIADAAAICDHATAADANRFDRIHLSHARRRRWPSRGVPLAPSPHPGCPDPLLCGRL